MPKRADVLYYLSDFFNTFEFKSTDMNRYLAVSMVGIFAVLCGYSQTLIPAVFEQNPTIKFEQSQFDFGTIREIDGSVVHKFEFTNIGNKPIVIEEVSSSCGCTIPTYTKAPIMPGKIGVISVTYNPFNRPGEFVKEVVIISNNRTNRNIITIRGNVIPRPRTVEDDYPVALTSGIRLNSLYLNFKYVEQGKPVTMVVSVLNTSQNRATIATRLSPANQYISIVAPTTIAPGEKQDINVTANFPVSKFWGSVTGQIFLIVNGREQDNPIQINAVATDDFTALKKLPANRYPKARLSAQYNHFGTVVAGKQQSKVLQLFNDGSTPLIVRSVEGENGAGATLKSNTTIEAGKSVTFTTTLKPKEGSRESVLGIVRIITNDPNRPMREIRLAANIE